MPARAPRGVDGGARHARHLRGLNLERVLNVAMDRAGSFTRAELIEATGLSAPTVGSLASDLIRSGVVRDLGTGPSSGGRRPSFMELNARHRYVAGIDLGPTRTRLAVADLRGDRVVDRIVPTPAGRGPSALLTRIAADLRALMRDADAPMARLLVVAAGAPGAVDTDTGVVSFAPNLKGWSNVPMRDILERALGAPVVVENDVNLAMLGEHWQGAARGHQTCAFVFVGTGIGAAVLVDGELHRGHHFMAGEIAVMCMGREYVDVDYGTRGCLETLAGLQALAARWPKGAHGDPEEWMAALFEAAAGGRHDGPARGDRDRQPHRHRGGQRGRGARPVAGGAGRRPHGAGGAAGGGGAHGGGADLARARPAGRLRAGQGRAAVRLPAGGREGSAPPRAAAARRDEGGREVKEER